MQKDMVPHQAEMKIEGSAVLVLAPHPDDEVFGCGGAIIRHVAAGNSIRIIVVTDGEFRVDGPLQKAYGALRRIESMNAANILGYGEPIFWGLPDGGVTYGEPLVQRIEEEIRFFGANLVYAPSIHEMHPDHRAVGMAALEAVRRQGSAARLAMYEVGVAMIRPNLLLDISDLRAQKQLAMACFVSQLKEQAYDRHIGALNSFRTYTLGHQVTAAEAYFVSSGNTLQDDVLSLYEPEYRRRGELGLPLTPANAPLVSVIVRSMDRPQLREALDSLALQTYPNIEVVVINALGVGHRQLGSRCGRFALRVAGSDTPLLRSNAANCGLESAAGEYVMFLDDDDWLAPDHIWVLASALDADPAFRVAYAGVELRGVNREKLDAPPFNATFNLGRLRSGNYIPIHALLFSRALIVEAGLRFDETLEVYEDWDFLLQLSELSAFKHVVSVGAYYRSSGTSDVGLLADTTAKSLARIKIFDKWKGRWSGAQIDEMVCALTQLTTAAVAQAQKEMSLIIEDKVQTVAAMEKSNAKYEENRALLEKAVTEYEEIKVSIGKANAEQLEAIAALERTVTDLSGQLSEKDLHLQIANGRLYDTLTSSRWGAKATVRWIAAFNAALKHRGKRLARRILGITKWPLGNPYLSQGFAGEELIEPEAQTNRDQPLVSVIMPVYNACRVDREYFLSALKSIQGQTYKNVELIVVDDGSTDDTKLVYEEFVSRHPDFRTRYLSKENGGQSSGRNFGVRACSGEYIGFIDQDDEWYLDKLEKITPWLGNKSIDVLYTDADIIDGSDKVEYKNIHQSHFFGWPHPKRTVEDILYKDIFVMPGLMTIKKHAFERIGGFDENLSGYEDDDLFLRLFESSNVFYLPIPTLRWRMYGGNYSFSHRMLTSRTYYWKKLLKSHTNNGKDILRVRMISIRFFQEFLSQALLQYSAGNDLYKKSLADARAIVPFLPKIQRVAFFLGFMMPEKFFIKSVIRFKSLHLSLQ